MREGWTRAALVALGGRMMRALILSCTLTFTACTSTPRGDPQRAHVVVTEDSGAELWRGKASFGVRSARENKAERVVSLPGLGEIQTAIADGGTCRFVWSKDGFSALTLLEGNACGAPESGRLCFDGARFSRPQPSASSAPIALVVDGCADENDLLWSKLEGSQPATVGPTSFRQRCRRLPRAKKECELTYVKKESVTVAHNDSGDDGFTLAFDGEAWRACFLERESGRYRIALTVEDTCGKSAPVLEGDSADLDD